jgi:hypothetical protein
VPGRADAVGNAQYVQKVAFRCGTFFVSLLFSLPSLWFYALMGWCFRNLFQVLPWLLGDRV